MNQKDVAEQMTAERDTLQATMSFKAITWWSNAFHVYEGKERIGIVNKRIMYTGGQERGFWLAHNKHFMDVGGHFASRDEAAAQLSTKPIHQKAAALQG
jgi:hypothetical protein